MLEKPASSAIIVCCIFSHIRRLLFIYTYEKGWSRMLFLPPSMVHKEWSPVINIMDTFWFRSNTGAQKWGAHLHSNFALAILQFCGSANVAFKCGFMTTTCILPWHSTEQQNLYITPILKWHTCNSSYFGTGCKWESTAVNLQALPGCIKTFGHSSASKQVILFLMSSK